MPGKEGVRVQKEESCSDRRNKKPWKKKPKQNEDQLEKRRKTKKQYIFVICHDATGQQHLAPVPAVVVAVLAVDRWSSRST